MGRKFVSMCLAVLMAFNLCGGALASNLQEAQIASSEGMTFTSELTDDGLFILTGFLNGKPYDRVTIEMGSNIMNYEMISDEGLTLQANNNVDTPMVYYLSDIITIKNPEGASKASYRPKTGNIGYITYRSSNPTTSSGYNTNTLTFDSTLINTVSGEFAIQESAGDPVSVIISAIVAGFAFKMGVTLAKAILIDIIGSVTGQYISNAFSSKIKGNNYLFNIKASASDRRTSTRGGETYYGSVMRNGAWVNGVLEYGDIYPEFIAERDTGVAMWFYNDFWVEPYTITTWGAA